MNDTFRQSRRETANSSSSIWLRYREIVVVLEKDIRQFIEVREYQSSQAPVLIPPVHVWPGAMFDYLVAKSEVGSVKECLGWRQSIGLRTKGWSTGGRQLDRSLEMASHRRHYAGWNGGDDCPLPPLLATR